MGRLGKEPSTSTQISPSSEGSPSEPAEGGLAGEAVIAFPPSEGYGSALAGLSSPATEQNPKANTPNRMGFRIDRKTASALRTLCRERPLWRSAACGRGSCEFPERHRGRSLQAEVTLRPHPARHGNTGCPGRFRSFMLFSTCVRRRSASRGPEERARKSYRDRRDVKLSKLCVSFRFCGFAGLQKAFQQQTHLTHFGALIDLRELGHVDT